MLHKYQLKKIKRQDLDLVIKRGYVIKNLNENQISIPLTTSIILFYLSSAFNSIIISAKSLQDFKRSSTA